ncbi:hypothetical protein [Pelagovum pacificum]|uniref:Uncharacterized protein n=1 Tax=Pelagovum pacificum TaxID=2588711 RepID=A0A5C5GK58_9RHOB|nr:hypothetical protein [Pelagovum pacificum]QQA43009.1 hypothetical protein I8N54_00055 [Pelagovum pacificum]TNY33846.1 hypothetical protein FHY64_11460 [Pelagovum pacificum]
MRHFIAAVAALTIATSATAQTTDLKGFYDLSGACSATSDGQVTITENHIAWWESACDLTPLTPIPGLGNSQVFDATCSGEGYEWTTRMLLMTDDEGDLVILLPDYVTEYRRC